MKTNRILALICLGLAGSSFGLGMQVDWLVPPLVTNTNILYYDVQGSGSGESVYQLNFMINPSDSGTQIRMRYRVLGSSSETQGMFKLLYEGRSNPYVIKATDPAYTSVNSKDFMKKQDPGPGIFYGNLRVGGSEDFDPVFRSRVIDQTLRAGNLVSGALRYEIIIEKNVSYNPKTPSSRNYSWVEVQSVGRDVRIQQITHIEALTPGGEAGSNETTVFANHPQFRWSSDMPVGIYGTQDQFEVNIYQRKLGQGISEAMQRPIYTFRTSQDNFVYPSDAPALEAGSSYVWTVKGLLQGVVASEIVSQPYAFKLESITQPTDPSSAQTFRALDRVFQGSDFSGVMDGLGDYTSGVNIVVDGVQLSSADFEALINRLSMGGAIKIQRVTVR